VRVEPLVRSRTVLPVFRLHEHHGLLHMPVGHGLSHVHVQRSVHGRPGLRRQPVPELHFRRPVWPARQVSGHTRRPSVHVLRRLGLRVRRDMRFRRLLGG
jgi:hypothetical protein